MSIRQFIDFTFFAKHRLAHVTMIPLGSTIDEAKKLYGEPVENKVCTDFPDATQYTFFTGPYHEAVVIELNQTIQSITYWSVKSDPARDLRCMFERYKGDSIWEVMEEGYWYYRKDGKVRLWCSVIPAIGVALADYFHAKNAYNDSQKK